MLSSSLSDYRDAYVIKKGVITMTEADVDAAARQANQRNKQVAFKNCSP